MLKVGFDGKNKWNDTEITRDELHNRKCRALVVAATKIFREKDVQDASMDDIAAELNVSKSAIYLGPDERSQAQERAFTAFVCEFREPVDRTGHIVRKLLPADNEAAQNGIRLELDSYCRRPFFACRGNLASPNTPHEFRVLGESQLRVRPISFDPFRYVAIAFARAFIRRSKTRLPGMTFLVCPTDVYTSPRSVLISLSDAP